MATDTLHPKTKRRLAGRVAHKPEPLAPAPATAPASEGRVFGYVRVSSDMQVTEGQSLEVQRRQLEGWAQMCERHIERMVVEPGISAGIEFAKRPEGGTLWAELRKGDMLVGTKLDRMFRSARDCLNAVHLMKQRGISFRLLDLGGGMEELTANGQAQFFLQVMAAVAELEREKIGERIRATKRMQKERGEYLGGKAQYGWVYVDKQLVPVPRARSTTGERLG